MVFFIAIFGTLGAIFTHHLAGLYAQHIFYRVAA
jgi:hypothetical protein